MRACEIRLPHSSYRGDVVGYRATRPLDASATIGQTAVFECKQSRADFLKDARSVAPALERLRQLRQRRGRLEQLLGMHYPSLRSGDSLFPEYESVACERLEHRTWRRVTREIRLLENRVHGKTKFEKLIRYRSANLFYLVTIDGLVETHEVPSAWGILSCAPESARNEDTERPPELRLVKKPEFIEAHAMTRLDLVQRVAAATSRRFNSASGLEIPDSNWMEKVDRLESRRDSSDQQWREDDRTLEH